MKQREIVFIVVSIFVLVIIYTIFNVFHNATFSTISPALSIQIQPIDPSFDLGMIDSIKQRNKVLPDLGSKVITATNASSLIESFGQSIQQPTPTPATSSAITNIATPSSQLNP